jgi:trehalose synthase
MALTEVEVGALPIDRLNVLIGPERAEQFEATATMARALLDGRTVFNLNSTATGGGVAELLQTLLAYARGVGVDTRWLVIEGSPRFFQITKRLHNHLYGSPGDGQPLGPDERQPYEALLEKNAEQMVAQVEPGDVVILHDPQTAGLAAPAQRAGAHVVWRCHVGVDEQNEHSERGWAFLRPYLGHVDAYVFSCPQFAPAWVPEEQLYVIPPSIDPFSAKNEAIDPLDVARILQHVGLLEPDGRPPEHEFTRRDGSLGRIAAHVDLSETGPPPPADVPIVLQASRWDALKDMPGVIKGFAEHIDRIDAHLVLAGPQARGVADDPEANQVLQECLALWRTLPARAQQRIHLACMPMTDPDEAAVIVNALQRHASVVVQKSRAEGFGLTVAEAMWKSRPVIGTAVGGIVDQIVPDETGILLRDPCDLDAYGRAVCALLDSAEDRERMGSNGRQRATDQFLGDRHLQQWGQLFARIEMHR